MPYMDTNGHEWSNPEPPNDDICSRCGVVFLQRGQYACSPHLVAVPVASGTPAVDRILNQVDHVTTSVPYAGSDTDAAWARIEAWMRATFEDDLKSIRAKFQEYGSSDLELMGRAMEGLLPRTGGIDGEDRRRAGIEMALSFYGLGKSSRMFSSWENGNQPSDDTLHDSSTYSYMLRYVRAHGSWS